MKEGSYHGYAITDYYQLDRRLEVMRNLRHWLKRHIRKVEGCDGHDFSTIVVVKITCLKIKPSKEI